MNVMYDTNTQTYVDYKLLHSQVSVKLITGLFNFTHKQTHILYY